MLAAMDVLALYQLCGAYLEGHFLLASGRHSPKFLQSTTVMQYPEHADALGSALAKKFRGLEPDFVLGPAMGGVVLQAGPASGFGLAVYIQHDNGDVTVYGHMDEILVSAGQVVQAGDLIALVGNRGQSTGPHLHFEVRAGGMDGEKIDPQAWLAERGVQL